MALHPGLQRCEWVIFHGSVNEALPLLDGLDDSSLPAPMRALWLRGVALGACGRYGDAFAVLEQCDPSAPEYSMALSLKASLLRQIGCHELAQQADQKALSKAATAGAALEATTGLAADAVGQQDAQAASEQLAKANALLQQLLGSGASSAGWWRHQVRLEWVACEVALMQSRHDDAAVHAQNALDIAERANAPRHVAKSLLFLAVSHIDQGHRAQAEAELNRCIVLSASMGYSAVAWPAYAVLAALTRADDPVRAADHLRHAAQIVNGIGAGLPEPLASLWLHREDIEALMGAAAAP